MRLIHLLLAILICAQAAAAELPAYRFLIVVDNSQSMNSRKSAVMKNLRAAIQSGFSGQIMPGDAFDVWTFADRLRTNRFPVQTWNASQAALQAEMAALFVGEEKFSGRTRFTNATPVINAWITTQTNSLILLVTDGEDAVIGLPNDFEINEYIAPKRTQARRARRAFFVSMLVQNGRVTEWRGYEGLGPFELPKLPHREIEKPPVVAQMEKPAEPAPEPETPPPPIIELPPGAKLVPTEVTVQPTPPPKIEEQPAVVVAQPVEATPEPLPTIVQKEEPSKPVVESLSEATEVKTEPKFEEPTLTETVKTNAPPPVAAIAPIATRKPAYFAIGAAVLLIPILLLALRRKPADGSLISKSLSRDQ